MTETQQLLIWIIKILSVVCSAVLYRLGGWKNKIYRRYAMPLFYFGACSIIALMKNNWSIFLIYAMLLDSAALHKGYGKHNDKLSKKIMLRAISGAFVAIAAIPYFIKYGSWSIFALHCITCLSFSIILGMFNQTAEGAASEEANIGIGYKLLPIMII